MGLLFTDRVTRGPDFDHHYEAEDTATARKVVVAVSQEAIDDYGLDAVKDKASDKYDAGIIDYAGRVTVVTTDFS